MEHSSIGYHTFSFFQKTTPEEFSVLTSDFIEYARKNSNVKCFNNKNIWIYCYTDHKGIIWNLINYVYNGYLNCGVKVIIDPKVMIEENYITAANESDLGKTAKIYNDECHKISQILLDFGSSTLNRADFCINIDLAELGINCPPDKMMELIMRANIPKGYKNKKYYDSEKSHRKRKYEGSLYLNKGPVTINYYWKYDQQSEKHPNFENREESYNVIRYEVQCEYQKLYEITEKLQSQSYECNGEWFSGLLTDSVAEDVATSYYNKIIRKGDYFTLDGAEYIVKSYGFNSQKEERMIYALGLISERRSIHNALKHLKKEAERVDGYDKFSVELRKVKEKKIKQFKKSLDDLDEILVNPVTIPTRWNIKHIINPLRAYYNQTYEQLISTAEADALNHINDYLNKCS